ncbi:MAG: hypothetical protein JWN14_3076 [Chthonomonadales bacterium]|nr:hypothetical protein [Chthonomonadales bacterium]
MTEVTLHKGGALIRRHWNGEIREYIEDDVTAFGTRFLYDHCKLAEGVTLRDIFTFMQQHIVILEAVLGHWCAEFVAEGLSGKIPEPEEAYWGEDSFDFLELYWEMDEDRQKNVFDGYHFPRFQGWGDLPLDPGNPGWVGGKKGAFGGINFIPTYEIMDIEVRLREDLVIRDSKTEEPLRQFSQSFYTLGHILYGIVREISYSGSSAMRKQKSAERRNRMRIAGA